MINRRSRYRRPVFVSHRRLPDTMSSSLIRAAMKRHGKISDFHGIDSRLSFYCSSPATMILNVSPLCCRTSIATPCNDVLNCDSFQVCLIPIAIPSSCEAPGEYDFPRRQRPSLFGLCRSCEANEYDEVRSISTQTRARASISRTRWILI